MHEASSVYANDNEVIILLFWCTIFDGKIDIDLQYIKKEE